MCDSYMSGLKEEPRRLREVEEARSRRRWEAKGVPAGWRANSIVKKVRETIEAR